MSVCVCVRGSDDNGGGGDCQKMFSAFIILLKWNYEAQIKETDRCNNIILHKYFDIMFIEVIICSNSFCSFLFIRDVLLHTCRFSLEKEEKACFYFI